MQTSSLGKATRTSQLVYFGRTEQSKDDGEMNVSLSAVRSETLREWRFKRSRLASREIDTWKIVDVSRVPERLLGIGVEYGFSKEASRYLNEQVNVSDYTRTVETMVVTCRRKAFGNLHRLEAKDLCFCSKPPVHQPLHNHPHQTARLRQLGLGSVISDRFSMRDLDGIGGFTAAVSGSN